MKQCQSCGMPLGKDPAGGGSNADGSLSEVYCSYCYQSGAFTQPDIDAAGMQMFCMQKMREQGMIWPLPWLFSRQIPRLQRWRG